MINKYVQPIQNTLEQYIPLPFDELVKAGSLIQERGDQIEQQQMAVQTGLSSMEALAPGYSQFRDRFAADYRNSATTLLDKYQGNTSNPEFIRDMRRLNLQYSSDPRLQTIRQGNELYKQNQQIAAKLRAEGKLFIQPNFTGVDERGNLTSTVPQIEGVNTLEEWANAGKIAHSSMEDIGTKSTNSRNLKRWRDSINNDTANKERLKQAYIQQGMTPQRAEQAVNNTIQGLINQYGVETKTNTALLNYGLNERQFAYQQQQDRNKLDLDRYKAETARLKAEGSAKDQTIKAPSFNEFTNRVGSVGTIGEGSNQRTIFGSGFSQYGTTDKNIKNTRISGKIYNVSEGQDKPGSKTIDIADGTLKGYFNAWVDKKTGQLLHTETPTSKPRIEYINGKPYAYRNGKPYEVEERTLAEYNYNAGTKDKPELKTIYKEAAPKEAMREMGYSNAYYQGLGRTQHGSILDTQGKVKLDDNFIKSNAELSQFLPAFKDAQNKVNRGIATEADIQLLKQLEAYDSRKSVYDNEILPYFKDQSKTKTIVEDE